LKEIRGEIAAYQKVLIKLRSVVRIHNLEEVKRPNQFYDVTLENEKIRIKAWNLPGRMWDLIDKILDKKIIEVYK